MGKQKQQVLSRFFAPKPKTPSSTTDPPPPPPSSSPKITTTVNFSPSKRRLISQLTASPNKQPKLSSPIPSLHQRFLQKLLEPSNPTPQPPSSSKPVKFTPLEHQVVELKAKYPDVLLMIEVGYKYRFFGEDAENAARVLGIYAHMDHNFLTASIPTFRLNVHVRRLVSAGYKVGVVKQTETAAIKSHGLNRAGPFCRGLSGLYTKATLEAAHDMGGGEDGGGTVNNYLLCVVEKSILGEKKFNCGVEGGFDVRIGIVGVEISTGDVVYGEFDDNFLRSELEAVVVSLSPAELLLGDPLSKQTEKLLLAFAGPSSNARVERASRDCFTNGGAFAEVMTLYENTHADSPDSMQNNELAELGSQQMVVKEVMNLPELAVEALALTIRHLKGFGFERILCSGALRPFVSNTEMTLSANTLQQLEVLQNNSDGSASGSLLQVMNHTLTIFGSRLLKHWVSHPLCDQTLIAARLNAVSEIAESMGTCNGMKNLGRFEEDSDVAIVQPELAHILSLVLTSLGRAPDIQRGITRIFHRTATPSEFIAIIQAILSAGKRLQQLNIGEGDNNNNNKLRSDLLKKLISTASSTSVIGNAAKMLSSLNEDSAYQGDWTNMIIATEEQFPEVITARKAFQMAVEHLDSLIDLYRKRLGMRKLEYMSVSGVTHLIELSTDVKVPLNWVKVNSTKKTIRYHPPEVVTALDELSLAKEKLTVACRAAWDSFLRDFSKHYAEFQASVQALASLDCLHSLAILSRNKGYVRPVFVDDHEPVQMQICSGRHPVLESILQNNFVPNDTSMHADREYCQIVTGPNMGGKSCYVRQASLIALMAQVGSFVPASSAKLHVLDGIYTRMGASDSIQQGRSTFLEELSETSHILHRCTGRSLVILDELGRGTSTHDGMAIAYATLHYLLKQKKSLVLFVTHYPKIASLETEFPGSVAAYHMSHLTSHDDVSKNSNDHEDITYLYKLVPGVSERSFGFKVAQLAQLPSHCISRAIVMASKLEALVNSRIHGRSGKELLDEPVIHQEQELHHCPHQEFGRAYKEFYSNLKATILDDDDHAKSFQLLENARSIAKTLVSR
ncbi:DNA mismatch repair protein MSH3 isoform X3 [Medicago truncatula]|uniref:DNA mismatch repair protein MSH3 n=2 Tax=Medicago truncatula TaxID=3880 RepID=A0A072VPI7_MEDTR|nr:DNA mismatch repair protein MSH3 isoform X3 [Medicago truncatula]KEH43722.1 DNA mismatch repair MSH3-like protein [Medicago truncatula]KEH43723.1 DNA mismatch repair MSH3-like protein [Medicago truncatula]